jgi:hypothetical protein
MIKKILLLLLILAIPIALSVPDSLTFQGRLIDKDTGEPLGPGPSR